MIQINKELTRPDKGIVAAGSLIRFSTIFPSGTMEVRYNLKHWVDKDAMDAPKKDGWLPITSVRDFSYIQIKQCTPEEYARINDAGSAQLVESWLKELIDVKIGNGNTKII
tara:strand:- start:141 stop:473 length:333 start_codon:yes stop_codon:yes gene_type:complete